MGTYRQSFKLTKNFLLYVSLMILQFENETRTNMDLFELLNWKDDAVQSCNK